TPKRSLVRTQYRPPSRRPSDQHRAGRGAFRVLRPTAPVPAAVTFSTPAGARSGARALRATGIAPRVASMSSRGPYILASVSRTVRTVELVAASGAMRLAELAASLGVSRPGAFRIARPLVAHRWLVQGDDRRYRIGPAARALTGLAADVDGDGERA